MIQSDPDFTTYPSDVIIIMKIPEHPHAQQYFISPEGLQQTLSRPRDQQYPGRHVLWTDDVTVELPIRTGNSGITALSPTTLIE